MATDLKTVKSSQKQLLLAALTKTTTENKMTRINKTRVRERERDLMYAFYWRTKKALLFPGKTSFCL